jgi:hypothetical protein
MIEESKIHSFTVQLITIYNIERQNQHGFLFDRVNSPSSDSTQSIQVNSPATATISTEFQASFLALTPAVHVHNFPERIIGSAQPLIRLRTHGYVRNNHAGQRSEI